MKKNKIIAVNLISFRDTKSVGTFVFIKRIFKELFRKDINDYKFIIYIQKGVNISDFAIPLVKNIEIVRVPSLRKSWLRIFFEQTVFYLYQRKCDYLFTPSLSLPFFFSGYKILTIHDLIPFFEKKKYSVLTRYYVLIMTYLAVKFSDKIVTVSESSKNDIMQYLKVKESKICVIYNFIPQDECVIKEYDNIPQCIQIGDLECLKLDIPYFLTVSTLHPGKNLERLIKAFSLFRNTHPDFCLYIVGNKGWNYEILFSLVAKLDLKLNVIFTGYLDDKMLSYLYSKCVAVVYVSLYEGFGIPPLEGFYHGKISLVSNISSMPEVVGDAGVLVNPYDVDDINKGMQILLNVKSEKEVYISQQLKKFSPKKQMNKFLDLFKK